MSVTYHPKDARVKCPYYQCYNNRTLRCKSIFDNQIATNLSFVDLKSLSIHMSDYCMSCWQACPLQQIITERIENDETK